MVQVPIAVSVALFEAICLYKGTRVIASKGKEITNWKIHQIVFYCFCGIVAGMVGGLLGLGGGFILGPLFLELGIPPQVCTKLLSQGQMEGGGNNFEVSQRMYQQHLITANLNPFFAGSKRNINICNDFLILNVCCAILSSRSFPGPLWQVIKVKNTKFHNTIGIADSLGLNKILFSWLQLLFLLQLQPLLPSPASTQ